MFLPKAMRSDFLLISICYKMASVRTTNKSLGFLPVAIYCPIINGGNISPLFSGKVCNIVPFQIMFLYKDKD